MLEYAWCLQGDKAEQVRWFRCAARAGDSTGMYFCGYHLALTGDAQDRIEAGHWLRRAVRTGSLDAIDDTLKIDIQHTLPVFMLV